MLTIPDTPEANSDLIRAALAKMSHGDVDACVGLLAPDFVINIAGMPYPKTGPAAWRDNAETMLTAFADVHVHVEEIVAAGDMVAVRTRITGTHTGEFLGTSPSGKRVDYLSHEFYRVEGGRIAEEWICSDTLTLLAQINASQGRRLVLMWLTGFRMWIGLAAGLLIGILGTIALWLATTPT